MFNEEIDMKCIVETAGKFMLVNSNGEEISSRRPSVATFTPFIDSRILKKDLRCLATDLPMGAEDEDFNEVYQEMIKGLKPCHDPEDPKYDKYQKALRKKGKAAVDSYCSTLGKDRLGEEVEVEDDTEGAEAQKAREEEEHLAAEEAEAKEKEEAEAKEKEEAEAKEKEEAEEAAKEGHG